MKRITITFDNGPTPGVTERVLEILAEHEVQATFFVIGQRLLDKAAFKLMDEARAAGHWIGNHSMNHMIGLGEIPTAEFARDEIEDAQTLIGTFPGQEKLFRPFGKYGHLGPHLFSEQSLLHLCAHDYTTVLWNSVPRDWADPDGWPEKCLADVAANDWTVAVLHDIENAVEKRLPEFLTRLKNMDVAIERNFPESVIVTRNRRVVTLASSYVSDRLPA